MRLTYFYVIYENKNTKICFVRLFYILKYCIVVDIGNENKQMWFASNKEVRHMIETSYLLAVIYILFYVLLGITIIALTLIVTLVVLLGKSKNQ